MKFLSLVAVCLLTALWAPQKSLAAFEGVRETLGDMIRILNITIWLLFLVAVIVFFFGIVRFLAGDQSPQMKTQAKSLYVWGLIGMFVLMTFWGIIIFIRGVAGF